MGYGGSRADAEAVGRSGDGGIDGIINQDKLGLDVIYVQAKRWQDRSMSAALILLRFHWCFGLVIGARKGSVNYDITLLLRTC